MKLHKRYKLVFGVGINDSDYNVVESVQISGKTKVLWVCPFYMKWKDMLGRCYYEPNLKANPTYIGCSVCKEWLTFSNFKAWMETQDWEGRQLDKDLLIRGNKLYSAETCVFIEPKVNKFMTERGAYRGEFPIGVCFDRQTGKYMAQCWSVEKGKNIGLGRYKTPKEAHEAWLAFKLEQAYILAAQQTDERVAKALIDRYENYVSHP